MQTKTGTSSKIIARFAHIALACALSAASPTRAEPDSVSFPPLNPQEQAAVIQEIKAMVKTDESQVNNFVVREATPSRIDRMFHMPEVTQQPRIIRENGLIFAGQGSILTFDKPSDIIVKMSSWFPNEVAAARASKNGSFFGFIGLYGPYPSWKDEQAAFLALWNCMPQIAWLKPAQNPFLRRLNDGGPFMHISSSGSNDLDFGVCVREHSTRWPARTREEMVANQKELRKIGDRVTPVLRGKFSRFLARQRCQGAGPDDCVLVLHLWSSLSPSDPELANAIQTLEAEVAPGGPLPGLQKPADQYERTTQEGEPRFDEALRKAAFLRAKLLSVLNAAHSWRATCATAISPCLAMQCRGRYTRCYWAALRITAKAASTSVVLGDVRRVRR